MEAVLSGVNSVLAVVVVLGLCLFFHEMGHFLAAKAFKMGVHQFAMGFGPALWGRRWRGTLYTIRLLPVGGFVHIAGMDGDERDAPDGFHSKPRWQGAIVICAGVMMNIVLAVLVYWAVNVFSGLPIPGNQEVVIRKVFPGAPAEQAGVRAEDRILGIGGSRRSLEIADVTPGSLGEKMGLTVGSRVIQVGQTPVAVPGELIRELSKPAKKPPVVWMVNGDATGMEDAVVKVQTPHASALAKLPAEIADAEADKIARETLGVRFAMMDQFAVHRFISANPGAAVTLAVLRDDTVVNLPITLGQDTDRLEMIGPDGKLSGPHRLVGRIGITLGPELERTGVIEGLQLGVRQSYGAVATVILSFKAMFAGKIAADPAGPIAIMAMTAETAKLGWASVLTLCGLISANLAVINLITIPPFDGGQILILAVEGLLRRRLNERLEFAVRVQGLILVLALFLYLTLKDVSNLVRFGTY